MNTQKAKYLFAAVAVLLMAMIMIACGSDNTTEQSENTVSPGWDYFESFNPIDEAYGTISAEYDSLEDSGVYDGGVALKIDEQDLYFGFPRYSKEEIEDTDLCTSVYGTLNTLFGIDADCRVDDLEKMLNVTFKEDIDDSLIGTALTSSGSYYVQLYTSNRDDELVSETGAAIFKNNDESREGADEVPSEQVWVDLHEVESSAIHSMGYDSEHEILAIVFRDSQELWYYYGVPEEVYSELETSESIGSYYNEHIKGIYASAEMH